MTLKKNVHGKGNFNLIINSNQVESEDEAVNLVSASVHY